MGYEGTVQGSAKEFVTYYQSEIQRQVENMRDMVAQLRRDASNRPLLEEIQSASAAISDLAMVYGFEGVEVIAERIHGAVRRLHDAEITAEFLTRLEEAIGAIEKTMILIDERREREIIRSLSAQAADSDDFVYVEPAVGDTVQEDLEETETFDIKEDEKLLSILSDADGEAYEIESKGVPEYSSETQPTENEQNLEFEPLESEEIAQHFENSEKDDVVFEELNLEDKDDVLDFQKEKIPDIKKKRGLWGKIGRLFGSKSPEKESVLRV